MGWQNEMVRIVRFLINDIDSTTYNDSRLEETILVGAQLVYTSVDFPKTYTIDVDTIALTPDPTADTKDNWFINLVCVKASCIILGSEAKTLAAQSYRITDGPSTIDVTSAYKAAIDLYKQMCDKYDTLVVEYKVNAGSAGQAILGPYTQEGRTNSGRVFS